MGHIKRFNLISILLLVIWVSAVLLSMIFNITNINKKQGQLVLEHAKNAWEKDMMFRKWVSMHGGVYVFPTKKTPPNPYLSHIKDRDIKTTDGRTLTLMNPAYTLRELMDNFSGMYGQKGHITALQPLNPKSIADKWETKVLKRFEETQETEFHEIYNYNNSPHLRYMKGMEVVPSCLKCHINQGYTVGATRGGVSITIPMKKYYIDGSNEKNNVILIHSLILLLSLLIGLLIYTKHLKSIKKEVDLNKQMKHHEEIVNQQSKLASLGEMLNNIAHQWRQPLSVISTSASGLKLQSDLDKLTPTNFSTGLESILTSTQYLSQTIDDFSNFVRQDKAKKEFKIEDIIHRTIDIIKPSVQTNNIDIVLDLKINIELRSYQNELTQVLINILNNAKDALLENENTNRFIFITTIETSNDVTLYIKDNGSGMEKNVIKKVFEPYFTTKHQSQGTGLGLYMSHKIITESLKGQIEVSNVTFDYNDMEQTGVEFIITLPKNIEE